MRYLISISPLLVLSGCGVSWQPDFDRLETSLDARLAAYRALPQAPATDADLDKQLSGTVDAGMLARIALDRNPEIREAAARARAKLEEVRIEGAFDDPALIFRADEVP